MKKRLVVIIGFFVFVIMRAECVQPVFGEHAPSGTLRQLTVCSGGLDREFYAYIPATLSQSNAVPLVFVFHGGGGDAKGTMKLTQFNSVADKGRFMAIYPQGIGKSWNDGRETAVSQAHRDKIDDVMFFDAMLERLSAEYRIDSNRVFVTGISNGGIFAHYLAAHRAEKIAAIAPVAGGIAEPFDARFKPTHPISVLMIQGTEDLLVPFDGGKVVGRGFRNRGRIVSTEKAIKLWLEADGISGQPNKKILPDRDPTDGCRVESIVWSGGRGGSEVWLYRVEGGGHTWPGGSQYLPKTVIGRVTHDIDSQSIWDFFLTHPKGE